MPIGRQLPLPEIPPEFRNGDLRKHLQDLHARLRTYVSDLTKHLGQFQNVPTANQVPTTGQGLIFDGELWRPGDVASHGFVTAAVFTRIPLDQYLYQIQITGADGTATEFHSPVRIRRQPGGTPQALLMWKTGPQFYVKDDPPGPLEWTLRGQTIVLGQPPMPDDLLYLANVIVDG